MDSIWDIHVKVKQSRFARILQLLLAYINEIWRNTESTIRLSKITA
jgi:hypothetical protein